jgi:pilus assembly protein FimV
MFVKESIISRLFNLMIMNILFVAFSLGVTLQAFALGLGEMRVKSALGQSLLVHADVVGAETELINPTCLRARVVTVDGIFIANAIITIHQNAKQRALSFSTRQAMNEPAINLIINIGCETQLHREFSILLDPPEAIPGGSNMTRDDSPFGTVTTNSSVKVESASIPGTSVKSGTQKKQPAKPDNRFDTTSQVSDVTKKSEGKRRKAPSASRDVLKLSDDIVMPAPSQGLRMSDVLSSDAGQRLIENTQELRAAQARMAAILRDDPQSASSASAITPEAKIENSKEIASLKQEAEQLRNQNLVDKAALTKLQDKSVFDFWLISLAIIAILAIAIVLFLLVYIRRNLSGASDTWWEGEEAALSAQPEKIEDAINNLQSSYDTKSAAVASSSGALNKRISPLVSADGAKDGGPDITSSQAVPDNSSFNRTPTLEETNSSIFNFFAPRGNSVKVEEISDVTQEAEFWISMNDPQRAIEILAAQEQVEQPDSPVPWLFLLDLYRTVKDRNKYDVLRDRFIVFFNANIPEFDTDLSQMPSRQLEDFPHLMQKICDGWNSNGIIPYLESLLVDDREGKRAGFDLPVYRDILMLLGIAHETEKMTAIEGPLRELPEAVTTKVPETKMPADHLESAEINTIEFETIDFPIMMDKAKN